MSKHQKSKDLSSDILKELEKRSTAIKEKAYAPYSKFRVGASVLISPKSSTSNGNSSNSSRSSKKIEKIFVDGCNVENASYGLAICAERNAFTTAIAQGHHHFEAVWITCDMEKGFAYPCGACRQFMAEFGTDLKVYVSNTKGETNMLLLSQLLPNSFGPSDVFDVQELKAMKK